MQHLFSRHEMSRAFNEWMRRYTDDPERFEREFRTAGEFIDQSAKGEVPMYGQKSADYLVSIIGEQSNQQSRT